MSYCDFNPRLFREFTSMKTKIQPAMSDDWVIVPETYRGNDGFKLRSEKLDTQIADIDLRRFLRFSAEQELHIVGLQLQGNFIVGNDRAVYTQEMYDKWKAKFDKRTAVIIPPKDYQIGHHYKTPCGAEYIYVGARYMSRIKDASELDVVTQIKKTHYVMSANRYTQFKKILNEKGETTFRVTQSHEEEYDCHLSIEKLTQKFAVDYGQAIPPDQCDLLFEKEWNRDATYVWLDTIKPSDTKLKLTEVTLPTEMSSRNIAPVVSVCKTATQGYVTSYGYNYGRAKGSIPTIYIDEDVDFPEPSPIENIQPQQEWKRDSMDDYRKKLRKFMHDNAPLSAGNYTMGRLCKFNPVTFHTHDGGFNTNGSSSYYNRTSNVYAIEKAFRITMTP